MAILWILLALFGFVLAGIGSGSSIQSSTTTVFTPSTITGSSEHVTKGCRPTRIKGASSQKPGCNSLPVKP